MITLDKKYIGQRVRKPTSRIMKGFLGANIEEILGTWEREGIKQFFIVGISLCRYEVGSYGGSSPFAFYPEDLELWENEEKYEGIYVSSKVNGLTDAFRTQIFEMTLGYNMHCGIGARSKDDILYLSEKTASGPCITKCKRFDLSTQYTEAVEFAKKFAEENKPKDVVTEMNGLTIKLVKDGFEVEGRTVFLRGIVDLTSLNFAPIRFTDKTWEIKPLGYKIGCKEFTMADLHKLVMRHDQHFPK